MLMLSDFMLLTFNAVSLKEGKRYIYRINYPYYL